jgi:hypothetical protein
MAYFIKAKDIMSKYSIFQTQICKILYESYKNGKTLKIYNQGGSEISLDEFIANDASSGKFCRFIEIGKFEDIQLVRGV